MIVVKLELWPGGDKDRAIDLGSAAISNESDLAEISTYSVRIFKGAAYSKYPGDVWRRGEVKKFPRRDQRWGPWELLALALESTLGDRLRSLGKFLNSTNAGEAGTKLVKVSEMKQP